MNQNSLIKTFSLISAKYEEVNQVASFFNIDFLIHFLNDSSATIFLQKLLRKAIQTFVNIKIQKYTFDTFIIYTYAFERILIHFSLIFRNKSLLLRMYQPPQASISMHPFSQEEQCLLLTFDQELKKTIDTLNIEKQKSNLFRKQKLLLEQEVHSKNSQLAEMTLIHELQKEKLKHELEEKIKNLQQINKIPTNKITSLKTSPKKKTIKKHIASESQAKEQKPDRQQKSLTKGFKLMLLQEFIQFFAALILTRIKFPRKFKSIKRILPMTFILLRLGVFILATQFKKVCTYIRSVTTGEERTNILIQRITSFLPLFSFANSENHMKFQERKTQGNKSLIAKILPLF